MDYFKLLGNVTLSQLCGWPLSLGYPYDGLVICPICTDTESILLRSCEVIIFGIIYTKFCFSLIQGKFKKHCIKKQKGE